MMKNRDFKIVKILDEYNVVINAGLNNDVKQNDKFQILDKKGSQVVDPDTNEVIGQIDLIKATVEVSDLHEKMCVCASQTHSYYKDNVLSSIKGIQSITDSMFTAEQERLNVDLTQVTGGKRKSNAKIQIGDTARLIKSTK